ncbi:MAG: PilN domain-containing protein [Desulfotignum sp.]|jgi:type IV pilus assembly protein PilN|nr:PilN domain-containing protein [Desulfotignum sp.]
MIRINLLPFRLARKRENIRQQVSIFFLSILLLVVGLTWYTLGIKNAIVEKRLETDRVNAQIAIYKERADRVTEIQKRLKILEDKLQIVASLKQKRDEQLVLLEDLQARLVPEQMWIETLDADQTSVTMTGIAFDNPTIANFMKRLEGSSLFQEIDLKQARIKKFDQGASLKAFELKCLKQTAAPDTTAKGK